MKPIVIVSPQYDYTSGGIKVMWALYGHLLARGLEVYMNQAPLWKDYVVIYPEIFHGNPANGGTVMRYILNKPGVMAANGVPGPTSFDFSDKLVYFSRLFSPTDTDDILFLPAINLNTFYHDPKIIKKNKCKFIGKGIDTHIQESEGLQVIDRTTAKDQAALAHYLRSCEVMYCFDPCTAMTEVARLCGCRVVMVNNTQYTETEFSRYEPGMNGISWETDNHASFDVEAFQSHYRGLFDTFGKKLDQYIGELL